MPTRVYRGRSAYEYRPIGGGCVTLCPLSASKSEVIAQHAALLSDTPAPGTYGAMQQAYLDSPEFRKLSAHTRRAYERYAKQLRAVFGAMQQDDIEPSDCRQWLDARAAAKSPVVANREFALLGTVFRWGYERGHCKRRPTVGVRRFPEHPRDRAVSTEELDAFSKYCGPRLRAYIALRMVVPLRQGELIALPIRVLRAVSRDHGLAVDNPSKRGIRRLIEWSEALQIAVDAVMALGERDRLFTWPSARGGKMTQNALQNEWKRAMRRYLESGGERFTEHDLRAAAVDNLSIEHAQAILGHRKQSTTRDHYKNRKPMLVRPAK